MRRPAVSAPAFAAVRLPRAARQRIQAVPRLG